MYVSQSITENYQTYVLIYRLPECIQYYTLCILYMFTWFKLPNPSYSAICIHYIHFSMYTVQRVNAWPWESRMDLRKIESLRIHMTCKFP